MSRDPLFPADGAPPENEPTQRRVRAVVALLLLLAAALAAGSARSLGETADERLLWRAGERVLAGDWSTQETTFQGPLPLYLNQTFASAQGAVAPGPAADFHGDDLWRARLGMLPALLLAGVLVFRVARRLFGVRAGLFALGAFALHPLCWGYGALVAVDMTHAAFTLLALEAALMHAGRPSPARVAWAGAAVGLALATKYLALLIAPILGASVLIAAVCAARREGRGVAWVLLVSGAAFALAALLGLHAAYLFRADLGLPSGASSAAMTRALDTPLLAQLVGLFPRPMLRGLDYQLDMTAAVQASYFHGRYAAGHSGYHAAGLALKTPLAVVLASGWGLLWALARLRRFAPALRHGVLLLVVAAAVPFAYLSFLAKLQVGIRYVLPLVPIGCVFAGALVPALRPWPTAAARAALGALAASLVASCALAWPNGIGYFNALLAGPENAWRWYVDSNADWGQLRRSGPAAILERHPDAVLLEPTTGPTLGKVAIYVRFRAPRDPEAPERPRHWLDPFDPVDHVGPAWLVYAANEAEWAAAARAAADGRRLGELAAAVLADGRADDARAYLDEAEGLGLAPGAGGLRGLLALRASFAQDPSAGAAIPLGEAWIARGRPDVALEVLDGSPAAAADPLRASMARAGALLRLQRLEEAVAALESVQPAPGEALEHSLLLAELYRRTLRLDDGIALLEREAAAAQESDRSRVVTQLERFRDLRDRWATYQERR